MKTKQDKWITSIPKGSHGSGDLQKRLWKLVSDYVRIRDWYKYKGQCVATGIYIHHWKDGDAGHFIGWKTCNQIFKFDERNIHLQSPMSNRLGYADVGHNFGERLKQRYGENILQTLQQDNLKYQGKTFTVSEIKDKMKHIIVLMGDLEEQPEYYHKIKI